MSEAIGVKGQREVDCMIAREVFGVEPTWRNRMGKPDWCLGGPESPVPRYSSTWDGAGLVVERMREKGRTLRLVAYSYRRTYATFDAATDADSEEWSEANGEHATPLALCLAALAAEGRTVALETAS